MKKLLLMITILFNQASAQSIEQYIDSLFSKFNDYSGVAIGIFHNGEIIFSKGYGLADIEKRIPITDSTNFRLASVTKQFTATSVLILQEQGKLNLNDKIVKYFPCLDRYASEVTIKNLLTHTSGLPDYEDFEETIPDRQLKDLDVLDILCKQDSLYFPSGTKYKYSNSGYALLALIVEKVSEKSFAEFVRENIFSKLGMKNSVAFEKGISEVKNRAFGYAIIDGNLKFNDQSKTSAVLGDGGIYSSVRDMFLWDKALYTENILSRKTLDEVFNPKIQAEMPDVYYGYGWRIDSFRNMKRIYHTGSTCGFSNAFVRVPQVNLSIIVLMNQRDLPALVYANKILEYCSSIISRN